MTVASPFRRWIVVLAFLLAASAALVATPQRADAVVHTGSIWVGGSSTGTCNPDPGDPANFDFGCRLDIRSGLSDGDMVTVQVWQDSSKAVMVSEDTYTASAEGLNVGGGGFDPGTYVVVTAPTWTLETDVPNYTIEFDLVNDTAGGSVETGSPNLNLWPYDAWNGTTSVFPCGREAPVDAGGNWTTDFTKMEHMSSTVNCSQTADLGPGDWYQLALNGLLPNGWDFQMAVQAPWFNDVDPTSTHAENIAQMAIEGITLGCDAAGNYCPDDPVNRGQMGSFLGRTLDVLAPSALLGTLSGFDDVPDSNTHAANIAKIAAAGITLGCSADGSLYCPDDDVTRAQMATFLARMLGLDPVAANNFGDVVTGSTHASNINAVAVAGITLGCNADGTLFCPDDIVTRAQMASFIIRALNTT